ncbi:TonB-dependent receptor plug domain-containing protein [Pseudoroseomonas wenyumeiae]
MSTVSQAAMMAGVAMALPGTAEAQAVAPEGTIVLPNIDVQANSPANTLKRGTSVNRLPGTVQDTPQTINVVPREVLEQQNVTTLEEALRNVPGITVSIGEGNGGVNGDQFRIRGFSAQNDVYLDGLRDFGSYVRDAFTYEDVAVIKGPRVTRWARARWAAPWQWAAARRTWATATAAPPRAAWAPSRAARWT